MSPNTQTTRPSFSSVLAPISAASHAGKFCAARRVFAASADAMVTGLSGAGGHEGSSRACGAALADGEVGASSGSPVQPTTARRARAISDRWRVTTRAASHVEQPPPMHTAAGNRVGRFLGTRDLSPHAAAVIEVPDPTLARRQIRALPAVWPRHREGVRCRGLMAAAAGWHIRRRPAGLLLAGLLLRSMRRGDRQLPDRRRLDRHRDRELAGDPQRHGVPLERGRVVPRGIDPEVGGHHEVAAGGVVASASVAAIAGTATTSSPANVWSPSGCSGT